MMTSSATFYMARAKYDKAKKLVESGEFKDMSDLIRYSMRLYSESLRMIDNPIPIYESRKDLMPIHLRVNDFVVDQLLSTEIFDKSSLLDQSVGYYLSWREKFKR